MNQEPAYTGTTERLECQHEKWTLYHDVNIDRWYKRCYTCRAEIDVPRSDIVFANEPGY